MTLHRVKIGGHCHMLVKDDSLIRLCFINIISNIYYICQKTYLIHPILHATSLRRGNILLCHLY